ncbi:MAG: hypothetical protein A3H93_10495 [Rhodocyclales bacterium RIFCSPLOWO2_02_FULL_63_24]|nr:MAG: hypothetical protein A3H93_10495 [Rhodocyclales bacterium RIFCSPLOWO2_02_FULL_63_24]
MVAALRNRLREAFVRWALRVRLPEPAPIVLTQRRVYVLPTRAGLAYAAALGVILLGAMNYNLSLGHALVFLLGGLGIVAILHTFRNLALVAIRPGRCEPVFSGSLARFDLVLDNQRPDARTSLRLFTGDEAPLEIDIAPHASTVTSVKVLAKKRGWLPMPRLTIETTWPLGLVRAWSYAVPDLNCLVYPAPAAKAPPLPWSGESARGSARDGRGADDFSGLRSHQVADPPRHIAWKAVARQDGPLLTKLFSGAAAQQLWLDWGALSDAIDAEQRLSILARWMIDADAAGLAWGLRLPAVQLAPDNGPAQLSAGLRALALHNHGAQ